MRRFALLLALLMPLAALAGQLEIHYFDIGQGDAALIISPTGKTILVDGGPPEAGAHLAERVKALVKGPLDLVILSHPHRDHLGGIGDAVRAVGAKAFLDPHFDQPSEGYRDLLSLMGSKAESYLGPADPARPEELTHIAIGDDAKIWLLWPRIGPGGEKIEPFLEGTRSDANSNSVVFKLVYGKTAFLFVGDAEPDTEDYLIQKNIDLTSTVLKVGHHGGRHSSTTPWLDKVKPRVAVISCAAQNDYGHPGKETLVRLASAGASVFRTDQNGEVTVTSDGQTVTVTPERGRAMAKIPGTIAPEVATGPILPGERKLSDASLDSQKRYGRSTSRREEPPPPQVIRSAPPADAVFIASKRSKVFHSAGCPAVAAIKDTNRMIFKTREDAAVDRRPAEDCHP
jgi:competence protein ComEC